MAVVPDSDRIPFWVKPESDKQPDTGPFSVGGRLRIPTSKRKVLKNVPCQVRAVLTEMIVVQAK